MRKLSTQERKGSKGLDFTLIELLVNNSINVNFVLRIVLLLRLFRAGGSVLQRNSVPQV